MSKFHVKKGDQVVVLAGKEKGKSGKIIHVMTEKQRVVIEGLQMIKKHTKKSQQNPNGAIVEREGSPALKAKHNFQNVHQVPKFVKIVVNMGINASLEKGALEDASKDLTQLTGRKPVVSKSKKDVANFKLRKNQAIGCRVTLRNDTMYEFFDRLVATALPRIRDFRGLSPRKFDGRGNYTFGVGHHDCDDRADQCAGARLVEADGFSVCRKIICYGQESMDRAE